MKSKNKTQYYTFWKFIILADEKCQRNIYIDGVMMLHYTSVITKYFLFLIKKNCPLPGKLLNLPKNIWNLRKSNIPKEQLRKQNPFVYFKWPLRTKVWDLLKTLRLIDFLWIWDRTRRGLVRIAYSKWNAKDCSIGWLYSVENAFTFVSYIVDWNDPKIWLNVFG